MCLIDANLYFVCQAVRSEQLFQQSLGHGFRRYWVLPSDQQSICHDVWQPILSFGIVCAVRCTIDGCDSAFCFKHRFDQGDGRGIFGLVIRDANDQFAEVLTFE